MVRSRGSLGIVLLGSALLLSPGCKDPGGEGWNPPSLFDRQFGLRVDPSPAAVESGDTLRLTLSSLPLESGVGWCSLLAHGSNVPVGTCLSPITAELGKVAYPVRYSQGEPETIDWVIHLQTSLPEFGISCVMAMDSIEIAGHLYHYNSEEVTAYLGGGEFERLVARHIYINLGTRPAAKAE